LFKLRAEGLSPLARLAGLAGRRNGLHQGLQGGLGLVQSLLLQLHGRQQHSGAFSVGLGLHQLGQLTLGRLELSLGGQFAGVGQPHQGGCIRPGQLGAHQCLCGGGLVGQFHGLQPGHDVGRLQGQGFLQCSQGLLWVAGLGPGIGAGHPSIGLFLRGLTPRLRDLVHQGGGLLSVFQALQVAGQTQQHAALLLGRCQTDERRQWLSQVAVLAHGQHDLGGELGGFQ